MKTVVVWIRKELRLDDNSALLSALSGLQLDEQLLCVFQLNPKQFKIGTKNHDYFFTALAEFSKTAALKGVPLHFLYGEPVESFKQLKDLCPDWHKLYLNEDSRGYGQKRDWEVIADCQTLGIEVVTVQDGHLHGAESVTKKDGSYYKVFTPFYRQWRKLPKQSVAALPELSGKLVDRRADFTEGRRKFEELMAQVSHDYRGIVGEEQGARRLNQFVLERMSDYERHRDFPALEGTSGLSAYLRTGELSIRKVWQAASAMASSEGQETFLKELAWRDFYHMIYHFNPQQSNQELKEQYRDLPWGNEPHLVDCWTQGLTGYPIIDAAMRQLNQTGWMHNRLRMLTASFLTKDLLVDWRIGEAYFAEQLIDYDPASNIGGWQWAASTGTDAVPYFRIFNPTTQSQKFDPEGTFIRHYLPVLEQVPSEWIHALNLMPQELQRELGIEIGKDYPLPIVDHQVARKRVLDFFKVMQ